MVKWDLMPDDMEREAWDSLLIRFPDYTLFQTWAWGEYKKSAGWLPQRWVATGDTGEPLAMFQGLYRKYTGGVGLVWGAGGPVGNIDAWQYLPQTILNSLGLSRLYIRFRSHRRNNDGDHQNLLEQGWKPSVHTLSSGWSMMLELNKSEEDLLTGCTKNWRHNLKRAYKQDVSISHLAKPNVKELLSIYSSMESFKDLEVQYSEEELKVMFEFIPDVVLFGCHHQGKLVAVRGCAIVENKAWDLIAAANVEARKLYASYGAFWALLGHCREAGVREYDLGGIDALQNKGVYDFKKGTGAEAVQYLGEWDWARPGVFRKAANWAIKKRGSRL
ncbi:MAG: lipid II:glycine glycyltransferase FemX [Acidobacteriota bacterium]